MTLNDKRKAPLTAELRSRRDQAIEAFAHEFLNGENQDLYREMLVTVCRLARDGAERGDVKLIHKALAELRYGLKIFTPYKETRKITIYGSSRTPEGHPDYEAALEFARKMSGKGWMVITGAGDGIMKAGHGGAGREASFGVAIRLPFEQRTNDIIAEDPKLVNFRYFFTRKLMFMKEASAVALVPGGFGTQDEGFEALTLVQTGKTPLIPIVMCERPGGTYWPKWRGYVAAELLRAGMVDEQDMDLFFVTDDVDQAIAHVVQFYRLYHSSRYVGEELVLRLRRPIRRETLQRINDEYAARILVRGRIEQGGPLAGEQGEYPEMPRLKLSFDKHSFGQLRRMIDVVNRDGAAD
jgi:uncharacterized protein (TIGR00730 family)